MKPIIKIIELCKHLNLSLGAARSFLKKNGMPLNILTSIDRKIFITSYKEKIPRIKHNTIAIYSDYSKIGVTTIAINTLVKLSTLGYDTNIISTDSDDAIGTFFDVPIYNQDIINCGVIESVYPLLSIENALFEKISKSSYLQDKINFLNRYGKKIKDNKTFNVIDCHGYQPKGVLGIIYVIFEPCDQSKINMKIKDLKNENPKAEIKTIISMLHTNWDFNKSAIGKYPEDYLIFLRNRKLKKTCTKKMSIYDWDRPSDNAAKVVGSIVDSVFEKS